MDDFSAPCCKELDATGMVSVIGCSSDEEALGALAVMLTAEERGGERDGWLSFLLRRASRLLDRRDMDLAFALRNCLLIDSPSVPFP